MSASTAAEPTWVGRASHRIVPFILGSLWGLQVEGLEHMPRSGPVIVACNHVNWIDGFVSVIASQRVRHTQFLAKQELFKVPGLGWWLRENGGTPLDRSRGDVGAMRWALSTLKEGGCLMMFPEGTRSRTGKPGTPKEGVAFLARAAKAAVLPARILSTEGFPWRKGPIGIRFGPPLAFRGAKEDIPDFSKQVMEAIFSL